MSANKAVDWSDSDKVRQTFVDFFVNKKQHKFIKSSPVVPYNDNTLLFINAGMNQFKPIFLGQVDSTHPFFGLKSAANSQKCIRAGGKHNDLEDVGKDTYHHTMFEMLGNWSFGDYFKQEAIAWAWEILTVEFGLDPSRLYATYYGGDAKEPLVPADDEARKLWLRHLPEGRVIACGMKDNFWEMGDTGPCGPCTEIHYDRVGGRDAAALVNADSPEVVEIWNVVFIQFNREKDGSLSPLPQPCVDTGMGFERLASVLIGAKSNYDIDKFRTIFAAIQALTGCRDYLNVDLADEVDIAYRVVADHIRCVTVAIADGALPSSQDRGYVVRRILRRAIRYGHEFLGAQKGFLHQLVDVVCETLGGAFPEIVEKRELVQRTIAEEELQFGKTLDKGIKEFKTRADRTEGQTLSGEDAFLLFTTFGFPLDLTQLMASERGMAVDVAAFEGLFDEFKSKSREFSKFAQCAAMALNAEQTHHLQTTGVPRTEDSDKYRWRSLDFLDNPPEHLLRESADAGAVMTDAAGSDESDQGMQMRLLAIWSGSEFVESLSAIPHDVEVGLVFDRTPFYAEAGGQVSDTGVIHPAGAPEARFVVENVQRFGDFVLHIGCIERGVLDFKDFESRFVVGAASPLFVGNVDYSRRALVAHNHTCTHLLNHALIKVLGTGVEQRGSLVDAEKLRFDFTCSAPLELQQLSSVEALVNGDVASCAPVYYKSVPLAAAAEIPGLRAVFGEAYPDPVRVVSVGRPVEELLSSKAPVVATDCGDCVELHVQDGSGGSVEFCGGTHVTNVGEILRMVIVSEKGVAKGIRRLTCVTGALAQEYSMRAAHLMAEVDGALQQAASMPAVALRTKVESLRQRLGEEGNVGLVASREMLKKVDEMKLISLQAAKARAKELQKTAVRLSAEAAAQVPEGGYEVFDLPELEGDGKVLGVFADECLNSKQWKGQGLMVFSRGEAWVTVLAVANKGSSVNCKEWLQAVSSSPFGGSGGGGPLRAQGVSEHVEALAEGLDAARAFLTDL